MEVHPRNRLPCSGHLAFSNRSEHFSDCFLGGIPMTRRRLRTSFGLVLIALIVVVVARRTTLLEARVSACRSADTVIVPVRLAYLKNFMSSSDSTYRLARDSVGLAAQNAAKVKLETKTAVCQ